MTDHGAFLQRVRQNLENMSPEQRAAYEATNQRRLHAINTIPNWFKLENKYIVVTGANTGIGYETVRGLSRLSGENVHVVLAVRDVNKGNDAAAKIHAEFPKAHLEVMALDVSSLASVKEFVAAFRAKNIPIDILINNAGIMAVPLSESKDGFELQFATNHLGHFLLTNSLLDLIRPGGRIVNLSSNAHYRLPPVELNWDTIPVPDAKTYDTWGNYAISKLSNVLFSAELNRRLKADGKDIVVASVHPGFVRTELQSRIGLNHEEFQQASGIPIYEPERGAECSLYTALVPGIPSGEYWDNCEVVRPHPIAQSAEHQRKLWEVSERLIAQRQ